MLIGISGKKQSGKNTVSNIIRSISILDTQQISNIDKLNFISTLITTGLAKYNNTIYHTYSSKFIELSFADKVKDIASVITNEPKYKYNTESFKQTTFNLLNITHRELLQKIGEGLRKSIDPDIWVKLLLSNYNPDNNIIITDVRYKNEADMIKNLNGILIRINRDTGYIDNHKSEIDLNDYNFDYEINNDSDLNELILKTITVYNNIKWK